MHHASSHNHKLTVLPCICFGIRIISANVIFQHMHTRVRIKMAEGHFAEENVLTHLHEHPGHLTKQHARCNENERTS